MPKENLNQKTGLPKLSFKSTETTVLKHPNQDVSTNKNTSNQDYFLYGMTPEQYQESFNYHNEYFGQMRKVKLLIT
ncbi:MAG: hypothetical protein EOO44_09415 [Flavobacterium sp.]|nr:MAG: hypothetical protein EOO44_09415 [Flavobacterium sp.]